MEYKDVERKQVPSSSSASQDKRDKSAYAKTMSQKTLINRLGNNVLQESQLLAEKKWILDALTKIKKQRNSLQIERLHLESMKYNFKGETNYNFESETTVEDLTEVPTTSAVNLMLSAPKGNGVVDVDKDGLMDEEIICNEQELDLLISNCLYAANQDNTQSNMEEDEDDEDDVIIDMNMLMNGHTK